MWYNKSNRYFCQIENFAYGEINERSFSNPHPTSIQVSSRHDIWCKIGTELAKHKSNLYFMNQHRIGGNINFRSIIQWNPASNCVISITTTYRRVGNIDLCSVSLVSVDINQCIFFIWWFDFHKPHKTRISSKPMKSAKNHFHKLAQIESNLSTYGIFKDDHSVSNLNHDSLYNASRF